MGRGPLAEAWWCSGYTRTAQPPPAGKWSAMISIKSYLERLSRPVSGQTGPACQTDDLSPALRQALHILLAGLQFESADRSKGRGTIDGLLTRLDRKSKRLNSRHLAI